MSLQEEIGTQTHTHTQRMKIQGEEEHLQARKEISKETITANTLISDLQPPELGKDVFLLLKSPALWCFVMAALTV